MPMNKTPTPRRETFARKCNKTRIYRREDPAKKLDKIATPTLAKKLNKTATPISRKAAPAKKVKTIKRPTKK